MENHFGNPRGVSQGCSNGPRSIAWIALTEIILFIYLFIKIKWQHKDIVDKI